MHHDINENGGRLTNAFRFVVQDSKRVEGPVPSAPCTIWPTDLQDPHDGGIEALADQVGRHEPFFWPVALCAGLSCFMNACSLAFMVIRMLGETG